MDMLASFFAFHQNAISNIVYIIQSNVWFVLLLIGFLGTVALELKAGIDLAVSDEQNII